MSDEILFETDLPAPVRVRTVPVPGGGGRRHLVVDAHHGAGVQNVFNKKPPLVDSNLDANENNSNTFPAVYDIQGRQLFVSGSIKF